MEKSPKYNTELCASVTMCSGRLIIFDLGTIVLSSSGPFDQVDSRGIPFLLGLVPPSLSIANNFCDPGGFFSFLLGCLVKKKRRKYCSSLSVSESDKTISVVEYDGDWLESLS
ncbi:hypothetical protein FKM82_015376 [Ascaphus truei]